MIKYLLLIISITLFATLNSLSQGGADKSLTLDTDGDGIPNYCDLDSDNDGIPDAWENINQNSFYEDDDTDGDYAFVGVLGDGVASYLDLDSDNDGILDLHESGIPLSIINLIDTDMNGIIDASIAVGVNGIADVLETFPDSGVLIYTLADSDGDGIYDFIDLTSNGSDYDMYAVGYSAYDMYGGGFFNYVSDPDVDGIMSSDTDVAQRGSPNSPVSPYVSGYSPATPSTGALTWECYPLPVTLISFEVKGDEAHIELIWVTASEFNNKGFYIERSEDALNWETLVFISSKNADGNSGRDIQYSYTDNSPLSSINYYRLRQVDFDDSYDYSVIRSARTHGSPSGIIVYPNPALDQITVKDIERGATLEILDMQGKLYFKREDIKDSELKITLSAFNGGIYLVRLTNIDKVVTTKFSVNR